MSAGPIRPGFELPAEALERYLAERLPGFAAPLTIHQFRGGQSNPSYLLDTPSARYVLRRKPTGVLLPGAHAIEREYRIMHALRGQVPVPETHLLCEDATVIGTPFFVMAYVEGTIYWDPALPELAPEGRRAHFLALVHALARLHQVDYVATGLADYGRPDGYLARQLARWSRQYASDTEAGRVPELERLMAWLGANAPAEEAATLVHGDCRIDNAVFAKEEPTLLALLDWELSTVGNPLADFAYFLLVYHLPGSGVRGLAGRDLSALSLPGPAELVDAYCAATGRTGIAGLSYYLAFNLFRLAGILHGIRGRIARGTAASAEARTHAERLEAVALLGWRLAQGWEGPSAGCSGSSDSPVRIC
jgi:aminoglycoside phosphotransferase (APT) family kinase protein